jgi:hypothetical protein
MMLLAKTVIQFCMLLYYEGNSCLNLVKAIVLLLCCYEMNSCLNEGNMFILDIPLNWDL